MVKTLVLNSNTPYLRYWSWVSVVVLACFYFFKCASCAFYVVGVRPSVSMCVCVSARWPLLDLFFSERLHGHPVSRVVQTNGLDPGARKALRRWQHRCVLLCRCFVGVYSCIFRVSERDQTGEVMDSLGFFFCFSETELWVNWFYWLRSWLNVSW